MVDRKDIANYQFLMLPDEVEGVSELIELALDIRWSWTRRTDKLWEMIDKELWDSSKNPWNLLKTVSREKVKELLANKEFVALLHQLVRENRADDEKKGWFAKKYGSSDLKAVAYFSMEYMLTEALPIYSGGLGNVAGDQLKAASDLGVPIIGVGLLYQQGYFRQFIDKNGEQQALYPYNDPGQLPITPLRNKQGEWIRLKLSFPGWSLWIRAWQVEVGRATLVLLDSNDSVNPPFHRGITSELYGGDSELRLKQEMLLGIGGWRLLRELGINPQVCHLNEGHAAFAVLERAYCYMQDHSVDFKTALNITRAGNLFTTHTAVPAGFDRFSPALMKQYLHRYATTRLQLDFEEFMGLGRIDARDTEESFNMAYLALRGSSNVNGVSELHSKVSQRLFQPLFKNWPMKNVPIEHVTNGIHVSSWHSEEAEKVWQKACGTDQWLGETDRMNAQIENLSDLDVWKMRNSQRRSFVEYLRQRLSKDLAASGNPLEKVAEAKEVFDPTALTLGFARRFATYKRPNMLLTDQERLIKILTNSQRPVQLVIAGKAHPADIYGKKLIKEWQDFLKRPEVKNHVVFISDYDMLVAENMVSGVDVWVNNPRRPWEACGTSGMKVLANGGLNLSELDGWWVEAYTPDVGWAIGDGQEHGEDPNWDAMEANNLYDILENEVVPQFYERDSEGVPTRWTKKIKHSMARLTPTYSANRAVREYTDKYYVPAATKYIQRAANGGQLGKEMLVWKEKIAAKWHFVRFVSTNVSEKDDKYEFEAIVDIDSIDINNISVQIYAEDEQKSPYISCMQLIKGLDGEPNSFLFRSAVAKKFPENFYTLRVVPKFEGVSVPLETGQVLWQK